MTHRPRRRLASSVLAGLALTGALVAGRADAGEEIVAVLPGWRTGQNVRYDIVRTRRKAQPDKPASETVARSTAEIEVVSASEEAYVIAWTHGETTFDAAGPGEDPLVKKMTDLVKGLRIEIEMDSEATIKGVRNWKDLQATLKKSADLMCEELKAKGMDAESLAKVRAQIAQMYGGKMLVEQNCTRDPQRYFMVFGYVFVGGKPVEYEDKLANPFGGEPFPCKARFSLRGVDRKSGVATIGFRQVIPPEDALRIMEKTLKDMAKRAGKPVADDEGLRSFSMEDTAEFRVELATGWIESLTHKRTTKSGGASQEDIVTFTRRADPAGPSAGAADFPDDENGRLLRGMARAGDDLSKPRKVEFLFSFASEKHAKEFAAAVRAKIGLESATAPDGLLDEWNTTVAKEMVPTHGDITKLEEQLTLLADAHGGEACGWDCVAIRAGK